MNRPQVVGQPTTYKQIQRGINVVVDLLAPTLGPTGGNIVSQTDRSERYELLTDSAVALRRVISLGSPQLDIGAFKFGRFAREALEPAAELTLHG